MQRNLNETFTDYKARRAAANLAVKQINIATKNQPSQSSREKHRAVRGRKARRAAGFGDNLRAAISMRQLTVAITLTHKAFVERMKARKLARLGQIAYSA